MAVGVEGTGSYGAELARTLWAEGLAVLAVDRPNRAARRLRGKSARWIPTKPPSRYSKDGPRRSQGPRAVPLNACGS